MQDPRVQSVCKYVPMPMSFFHLGTLKPTYLFVIYIRGTNDKLYLFMQSWVIFNTENHANVQFLD